MTAQNTHPTTADPTTTPPTRQRMAVVSMGAEAERAAVLMAADIDNDTSD
jgi:hypothetical protein